jgi:Domain of unknown function (DUF4387)
MSKVAEVCRHVRSKNAGPFWVTVDLFFRNEDLFRRYRDAPVLGPEVFARLYETDPKLVKRQPVDNLRVIKISFPRPMPQGWMGERDMHAGQHYARLLDVELG